MEDDFISEQDGSLKRLIGVESRPYEVWVGRNPSRIDRGRELRAHQFVILDPSKTSGAVGVMEDAQPAHYVFPP